MAKKISFITFLMIANTITSAAAPIKTRVVDSMLNSETNGVSK